MRRLAATAALAALLFAASPAGADAFTDCFGEVSAEVDSRIDALPAEPATKEEKAELRALLSVRKTLDRVYKTLTLAVDAKNASKIVKTLLKAYPEDGEIEADLDDLVDCLESHCIEDHDALQVLITGLPEGKKKDGLTAAHIVLDEKIAVVGGLVAPADRIKALGPVAKGLVSLRKKFGKVVAAVAGKSGVSAVIGGSKFVPEDIEASMVLVVDSSDVAAVSIVGVTDIPASGAHYSLTINFSALVDGLRVEPGTYDLLGLPISVSFTVNEAPAPPVDILATSGTLTLMVVDPDTGSVAGLFEGTGSDLSETPVPIRVKFNLTGLPVVAP